MSLSVGFISLGCSKNLVDSQVMAGYLKAGHIKLAPSPEVADIILVNTCAFIEAAREEAAEAILSACEHKSDGACKAVIVTGCMVQRYRARLKKAFWCRAAPKRWSRRCRWTPPCACRSPTAMAAMWPMSPPCGNWLPSGEFS